MARTARTRKLTFPSVGIIKGSRVWRNRETGVEIIKSAHLDEVHLYYVCVPTLGLSGRIVAKYRSSFSDAFVVARSHAAHWRTMIAKAYTTAHEENASRFEGGPLMQDRETVQMEQIAKWLDRHGLFWITAENIVAAREADHAEALDL